MLDRLTSRWHEEGGYKEILKIAFPLILSTGSMTIQHFVDRMFLTWHSAEAVAAASPAGLASYTFMSLFIGTATYINTFVAQYSGADRPDRIGPVVWQGLYFSVFAGLIVLPLYPLSSRIFAFAGHPAVVQDMETQYFQIMIFSGFAVTAGSALAGFFSGRGKTHVVMWVTFATTAVNILLDYGLIFGKGGLPHLGVRGAALATVIAQYFRVALYFVLMTRRCHRKTYGTLRGWKPDRELFARILRYGFPNGLHYFLELAGFTILILLIGRLGTVPLAATNITFNINHLIFLPLMGFGMAVSILVGRRIGEEQPETAQRTTWSTLHVASLFIGIVALLYIFWPALLLYPYGSNADPKQFAPIARTATILLKIVATYVFFDMANMIFAAAIKGAGDTRFVMIVSVLLSWILSIIPSFLAIIVFNQGLTLVWGFHALYITGLGITFLIRFLGGKWKSMRVIESPETVWMQQEK